MYSQSSLSFVIFPSFIRKIAVNTRCFDLWWPLNYSTELHFKSNAIILINFFVSRPWSIREIICMTFIDNSWAQIQIYFRHITSETCIIFFNSLSPSSKFPCNLRKKPSREFPGVSNPVKKILSVNKVESESSLKDLGWA